MKRQQFTYSLSQTQKIAKELARDILRNKNNKNAFVVALEGDLGSGKTAFVQGFAKGLGIKEKILSPTFVILKKYQIPNTKHKIQNFYHIDCYRIQKPKEVLDLGLKEIISNPQNIIAIEWADRVKKILSKGATWIRFGFIDEKTRKIIIKKWKIKNV